MSDDSNISIDEDNNPNNDLEVILDGNENDALDGPVEVQEEGSDGEERKVVKPKKRVLKPRVKFNAETLKSSKGIAALPSYFERVKFKGAGHEEKDLNVLLKTYEYWCHRLFPKYPFDDCVAKIEKLGSKKEVQTHIKRIRMDLLPDDIEPMQDDGDNNQENDDEQLNQPEITEEQLERIRLNKERAERIRWERLRQTQQQQIEINSVSPNEFPTTEELEEINNPTESNSEIPNTETEQSIDDMLEEIHKVNQE